MATLNFTRQGEIYVAETIVTGDYLLHLERTNSGWLKMYQCSTSDGQFAPCFMPNNPFVAGEIYDWAYSHGVYPESGIRIRIESETEVVKGVISQGV